MVERRTVKYIRNSPTGTHQDSAHHVSLLYDGSDLELFWSQSRLDTETIFIGTIM